jgi:hypothetical protein
VSSAEQLAAEGHDVSIQARSHHKKESFASFGEFAAQAANC